MSEGSCANCAGDVQGGIGRLPGVRSVDVLTAVGLVVVEHDERAPRPSVARRAAAVSA
ncbi:MAG: heavy-metal-associated domain-containing protein [Actinomycetota bacterium]